ncbi:hypothetical protein FLL45_01610 [Aliikangiella marina]|uniref:Uncharacterized protein n=1 Tax=Aliikangiella marina TaxID=1712262 RepID=A0A545THH6_9GAMM|nr:hypothetical protein [Aliikangiella marina]TQV76684.1 hypothetical protein FLL45_01610 [Aliikangiella marina]
MIIMDENNQRFVVLSKKRLGGTVELEFFTPNSWQFTRPASKLSQSIEQDGVTYEGDQVIYFDRGPTDFEIAGVWRVRIIHTQGSKRTKSEFINFVVGE